MHLQPITDHRAIVTPRRTDRNYSHAPLALRLSQFPDFSATRQYLHQPDTADPANPVEVDVYAGFDSGQSYPAYLGVDVGSTSTKAVLVDPDQQVLAGFYTRTAGNPLAALQSLLAALDDLQQREGVVFTIQAMGTTGSGRKFIGRIAGADLVVDEITAHAQAAAALNPEADTIIEIGGQDAKFTTLDNGMVTFAVMNAVCAAGTGSFIEEQALQLGCPLSEVAARTLNRPAPMASDRCTVFMERDLNHYLNEGYSVDEVLTAVLHSVRENYLTKVAVEGLIGKTVLFQGATAKNQALVAAFEQRLNQPIHVSRYCHLTGALGVALMLIEQDVAHTTFRGIGLWRRPIPLHREICDLCPNHCKITIAEIGEEKVAYGFSCGRDYDTKKYVHQNPSGFDLLKERAKAFAWKKPSAPNRNRPVIGIPAALYLFEDLDTWHWFFNQLGFDVVTSHNFDEGVTEGRRTAGAQFCAPMAALHGHVKYLQDCCDIIFLPYYLEAKSDTKGARRQYCYYTQYSVPLASAITTGSRCTGFMTPLVNYLYNSFHTKIQLYKALKSICPEEIAFRTVAAAYDRALDFKHHCNANMQNRCTQALPDRNEIYTVLLGRPYTVLSRSMNKGIPDIFAALGVKTFFQDMLAPRGDGQMLTKPLLKELHWHHAAAILAAAEEIGRRPGAYPVLITSFKCSPDSFVIEYFKQTMTAWRKPYLILQVDDHDTSGGYETRIEAAVRAFQNHHQNRKVNEEKYSSPNLIPIIPKHKQSIEGKTLLLPNWDNLTIPLIGAALRREGIDARVVEHSPGALQKSLRYNTGQCIPVNIIAQECIDYIEAHDLDPGDTMLWMPQANIACNIHLYPAYIQQALHNSSNGKGTAGVYVGPMSMSDLSMKMPVRAYFAYMFGGYLRRLGCRLRPYEKIAGSTDAAQKKGLELLMAAFAGQMTYEEVLPRIIALFTAIDISSGRKPKVAIFGDLYARDNESINQNLIPFIEANGGEVLTTPYSDYLKMIARPYLRKWLIEGHYLEAFSSKLILAGLKRREKAYYAYFNQILDEPEPEPEYNDPPGQILSRYNLRPENSGESMDNLLKIHYLVKHHPDIALMVQVSPAFCCPALVTEAMTRRIEQITGIPIVSITYDGTGGNKNEAVIPYLTFPRTNGTAGGG